MLNPHHYTSAIGCALFTLTCTNVHAFNPNLNLKVHPKNYAFASTNSLALLHPITYTSSLSTTASSSDTSASDKVRVSFIDTELRGAAMKLHTRKQAPKEGQAPEKPKPSEQYVTTHADYLNFLVNSQAVFQALEDAVECNEELKIFKNTGLERVAPLEKDIEFMVKEYKLERPEVGELGKDYAEVIKTAADNGRMQEFMCHYYNFYFAHTAGGRMIGKQMSALLLDKKTLEFYKWDGDINEIKETVKNNIEDMAAKWSKEEKAQCVDATAAAFKGGGGINLYLIGGKPPQ